MTARLPYPGGDSGNWGSVLNSFLTVSHNSDGSLSLSAVISAGAYVKPSSGIPLSDLSDVIQNALQLAGTSVQANATAGGDLSGGVISPTVSKLQGTPIGTASPSKDQVLTYNGTEWVPANLVNTGSGGSVVGSYVDLSNNQTVGGTKTFTSTIVGSVSGNAATVTTNANLAGPITSNGNTTAVASQTGAGSTFVMSNSPAFTGTPTAPTATAGANTTQLATTAFVTNAVSGVSSPPNASSTIPGLIQMNGDFQGSAYNNPQVKSIQGVAITGTPSIGEALVATGSAAASWSAISGSLDWINAKSSPYNAVGNGTTDDTSAIQSALNAAPSGGTVYLPAGTYKTTAALIVPPTITFRGTTRTLWFPSEGGTQNGVLAPSAKIMPANTFSGTAVIKVVDQSTGGYSAASGNQTLAYLTIDGSNLPNGNSVDGFQSYGSVMGVTMDNCAVTNIGGHGVDSVYHTGAGEGYGLLDELDMRSCIFNAIAGDGVHLAGTADSTFTACHAINCHNAWSLEDCGNSRLIGCKAEWSAVGWNVTCPTNTGAIMRMTFVGCSTDNNTGDGFYMSGSQTGGFALLDGCDFHEDGRGASGSAAGIHIDGVAFPVIISGCGVFAGATASVGNGPTYGVSVTNSSSGLVSLENCYLQGATNGYHTDNTATVVVGTNVIVANGGTDTAPAAPSVLGSTAQAATVLPSDDGFFGWAYDPVGAAVSSNQPTGGQVIAVRVKVPACTISSVWVGITSAGSGLTSGQNFAGLYTSNGATLLSATGDQTSAWASTGAIKMTLTTPQVVPAGWVYVAWFSNGTTKPGFQTTGSNGVGVNANLTNATARFATGGSGATTAMPSSLTLSTTANAYWAAVS